MGLEALKRCKADGEDVALVLADQWMEVVAQHYRRVAHYGGEDVSRGESGSEPRGDYKPDRVTTRIRPGAPCACSRSGV